MPRRREQNRSMEGGFDILRNHSFLNLLMRHRYPNDLIRALVEVQPLSESTALVYYNHKKQKKEKNELEEEFFSRGK